MLWVCLKIQCINWVIRPVLPGIPSMVGRQPTLVLMTQPGHLGLSLPTWSSILQGTNPASSHAASQIREGEAWRASIHQATLLVSSLLMFLWPQQVTQPSPESINRKLKRELWFFTDQPRDNLQLGRQLVVNSLKTVTECMKLSVIKISRSSESSLKLHIFLADPTNLFDIVTWPS